MAGHSPPRPLRPVGQRSAPPRPLPASPAPPFGDAGLPRLHRGCGRYECGQAASGLTAICCIRRASAADERRTPPPFPLQKSRRAAGDLSPAELPPGYVGGECVGAESGVLGGKVPVQSLHIPGICRQANFYLSVIIGYLPIYREVGKIGVYI